MTVFFNFVLVLLVRGWGIRPSFFVWVALWRWHWGAQRPALGFEVVDVRPNSCSNAVVGDWGSEQDFHFLHSMMIRFDSFERLSGRANLQPANLRTSDMSDIDQRRQRQHSQRTCKQGSHAKAWQAGSSVVGLRHRWRCALFGLLTPIYFSAK